MARVLIVEREPDLRLLAQEAVLELGHEAVVFDEQSGSSGIDVLLVAPFAGIGALVGRLRRHRADLPVICAETSPAGDEAQALQPVAFLVKPYSLRELDRALGKALAR